MSCRPVLQALLATHSVGDDAHIVPPQALLATHSVGADDPVAVPKISALPYGGRSKF